VSRNQKLKASSTDNPTPLCQNAAHARFICCCAGDGCIRLRESTAINQSVSAIRRVFETLKYNQSHADAPKVVPYRTNKLTMLLKPMFTGKAGRLGVFTVLLNAYPGKKDYDEKRACLKVTVNRGDVSPAFSDAFHTIWCALQFACDAKDITVDYEIVRVPEATPTRPPPKTPRHSFSVVCSSRRLPVLHVLTRDVECRPHLG
jgi:hypothetical protein